MEAKWYNEKHTVGVKEMSRLISRIRYRQFGVMISTSYVYEQAYKEIIEDGHLIFVVSASDIAQVLRRSAIDEQNINEWLIDIDEQDQRELKKRVLA